MCMIYNQGIPCWIDAILGFSFAILSVGLAYYISYKYNNRMDGHNYVCSR